MTHGKSFSALQSVPLADFELHNLSAEQPHSQANSALPSTPQTHIVQADPRQRGRHLWSLAGSSDTGPRHLSLGTWSLGCLEQPCTPMTAQVHEGERVGKGVIIATISAMTHQ